MPKLTIDGNTQEFEAGTRLSNAIESMGINIGHRCGGQGRCTTCRVEISSGEPDTMTQAEYDKLVEKEFFGSARLSCQMTLEQDTELSVVMTLENTEGWTDTGKPMADGIEPDAAVIAISELKG